MSDINTDQKLRKVENKNGRENYRGNEENSKSGSTELESETKNIDPKELGFGIDAT